ncbi:MAG: hypothetical protein CFE46_15375 [Burkholderiales bacterium PBB6]|nr:MAG: hypothetical protein CFE46_15375 [Burkholderiales bacterium PBB6]
MPTNSLDDHAVQYMNAAREGLAVQTSAHTATWHFGEELTWAANLDTGTIVFSFSDGVTAPAPIQVVGSYNTADGTFLWGWDHPSVPQDLRKHAVLARQWGEKHRVQAFTSRKVQCTEDDAWGFAATTNRLAQANGVYRGPSDTARFFMTLGEITLARAEA